MGGIGKRVDGNTWIFFNSNQVWAILILYMLLLLWYYIGFGFITVIFIAIIKKLWREEKGSLWQIIKKVHNEHQNGLGLLKIYFIWAIACGIIYCLSKGQTGTVIALLITILIVYSVFRMITKKMDASTSPSPLPHAHR